jgi:YD repeat-containing protein
METSSYPQFPMTRCTLVLALFIILQFFISPSLVKDAHAGTCPVAAVTGPITGGAALAVIPVEVPARRPGLTPWLNLTYNSEGAHGWLGRGWDLELGSIQRRATADPHITKFYYVQGNNVEELVAADSPYQTDEYTWYSLKTDRNGATFIFQTNQTIQTWTAVMGGLTYRFGRRDMSANGSGTYGYNRGDSDDALLEKWSLVSITDQYNNKMDISYTKIEAAFYPANITYGPYTVAFDVAIIDSEVVLEDIRINYLTQEISRYDLTYKDSADTRYSLLSEVTHSANGVSRPPVTLEWETVTSSCDYVKRIDNGQGGTASYSYQVQSGLLYRNNSVVVLKGFTKDDGQGNTMVSSYVYREPNVNRSGSLVFKYIDQTNPDKTKSITEYLTGDGPTAGLARTSTTYRQDGPISRKVAYSWNVVPTTTCGSNCGTVRLTKKETKFYKPDGSQSGSSTVENYYHDDNNNLKQITSSGQGRGEIIYDFAWKGTPMSWSTIWWQPNRVTTWDKSGKTKTLRRNIVYNYGTDGALTSKDVAITGESPESISKIAATIIVNRDSYGNITQVKDPNGRDTFIEYDGISHHLPTKIKMPATNGVQHIISAAYNYRTYVKDGATKKGKIVTMTDENNQTTTYNYDLFGRLDLVSYPDGGGEMFTYMDYDPATPDHAPDMPMCVKKKIKGINGWEVASLKYFDGMGRTLQVSTPIGANKYSVVSARYNNNGRINTVTGPYAIETDNFDFAMSHSLPKKTFSYDTQGKIMAIERTIEDHDNQKRMAKTSYWYPDPFTTHITDPDNKTTIKTADDLGRITQIKDAMDVETKYTYTATGMPLTITGSNSAEFKYDLRGSKTSAKGPSSVTWAFSEYDGNGNLMKVLGPDNTPDLRYTYDELNRRTSMASITSGVQKTIQSFSYDGATNGKGRLFVSTRGDVKKTINSYDSMGRVTDETTAIANAYNGSGYQTIDKSNAYSYDPAGRLEKFTYPDGTFATYSYISGTDLISSLEFNVIDHADFTYKEGGFLAKISYSNGTTNVYDYYPESLRLKTLGTVKGTDVLQKWEYQYTRSGDMMDRIEGFGDRISYGYGYDNLHRLTDEMITGVRSIFSQTYKDGGNISSRTDYDTTKPHTHTYNYNDSNRLISITGGGETLSIPSYDKIGNETQVIIKNSDSTVDNKSYSFTPDGLLDSAWALGNMTSFTYDAAGRRASKLMFKGLTPPPFDSYTYYFSPVYETKNGVPVKYILAGDMKIAQIVKLKDGSENVTWFHPDHLGSTTLLTTNAGDKHQSYQYMPFGNRRK